MNNTHISIAHKCTTNRFTVHTSGKLNKKRSQTNTALK